MVAQMTRVGQLSVQQALVQSLEDGTTKEQFVKAIDPPSEDGPEAGMRRGHPLALGSHLRH